MENIRIALCDDEEVIYKDVRRLMDDFSEANGVNIQADWFPDGRKLLEELARYELILLDIEMPGMDGISFGREARKRQYPGKIIMLTGRPERFREVFEFQAFRFVTKLIDREELFGAISAYMNTRIGEEKIEVFRDKRKIYLEARKICYIRSDNGTSRIFTNSDEFRSDCSLEIWEQTLDTRLFVRSSRQMLVNVAFILKADSEIELITGEKIPCSRRKRKCVRDAMETYDLYYR